MACFTFGGMYPRSVASAMRDAFCLKDEAAGVGGVMRDGKWGYIDVAN